MSGMAVLRRRRQRQCDVPPWPECWRSPVNWIRPSWPRRSPRSRPLDRRDDEPSSCPRRAVIVWAHTRRDRVARCAGPQGGLGGAMTVMPVRQVDVENRVLEATRELLDDRGVLVVLID